MANTNETARDLRTVRAAGNGLNVKSGLRSGDGGGGRTGGDWIINHSLTLVRVPRAEALDESARR
jgi:hypothetical protein